MSIVFPIHVTSWFNSEVGIACSMSEEAACLCLQCVRVHIVDGPVPSRMGSAIPQCGYVCVCIGGDITLKSIVPSGRPADKPRLVPPLLAGLLFHPARPLSGRESALSGVGRGGRGGTNHHMGMSARLTILMWAGCVWWVGGCSCL